MTGIVDITGGLTRNNHFAELNIPEDNQCLRFILLTVTTFGNVEVLRREFSCWLSLLGNGAKANTPYKE